MTMTSVHIQIKVSKRLTISVIKDDITKVKADAVVTGEGASLSKESFVTRALQSISPSFKDIREKLRRKKTKNWTVYSSELGIPFGYVIHAILDSQKHSNGNWMKNMEKLYRRVLERAEKHPIRSVALPVLGTGVGDTDKSLAVTALVSAVMRHSQKYITDIKIVCTDGKIIEMVDTQLQYAMAFPESKPGFVDWFCSKADDLVNQPSLDDEYEYPHWFRSNADRKESYDHRKSRVTSSKGHNKHPLYPSNHEYKHQDANKRPECHGTTTWYTSDKPFQSKYEEDLQLAIAISESEIMAKENSTTHQKQSKLSNANGYSSSDSDEEWENPSSDYNQADESSRHVELKPKNNDERKRSKTNDDSYMMCPICLGDIVDPKQLSKCGHIFCEDCIERSFRDYKPVCPCCNTVYGVITGNQPDGTMDVKFSSFSLPGYPGNGTITITYEIPSGIQKEGHPSPGQPYTGTARKAYLPENAEGKAILTLLRIAFDRKLTFTIGRSTTTGRDGVVTWNDIHHKTSIDGGPTRFGYPDPTYLSRVRDELAAKGITEE